MPTITSMAEKGEPDVTPEAWIDLLPDVVKKGVADGKLIQAANGCCQTNANQSPIPQPRL